MPVKTKLERIKELIAMIIKPKFLIARLIKISKFDRVLPNRLRLLPDYIIIGAQRSGTTFLHRYLMQHPSVAGAFQKKEVHFFDINFKKGINWYRDHFPSVIYKGSIENIFKQNLIVGESSPYYIYHPYAPKRILKTLPQVKLIILLRNPIDRAYSHYYHEVRQRAETLSFTKAIEKEKKRLNGEMKKMHEDENYYSFNHHHYSYLSRGIYVDQLKVWMGLFPEEQFLIINSDDLFNDPSRVYKRVLKFLNLPKWEPKEYRNYNPGNYPKMDASIRKRLNDYFEPHNRKLYEFLGINFNWT